MEKHFLYLLAMIGLYALPLQGNCQKIYGAEIYKTLLPNNAAVEIWVWREASSKPYLLFDWGDGSPLDTANIWFSQLLGSNGSESFFIDQYRANHQYDSTGIYRIGFRDSVLVQNILNIENSGEKSIAVFDSIAIYPDSSTLSLNTSPVFFAQQGAVSLNEEGQVRFLISIEPDEYFFGDVYRGSLVDFPAEGYVLPMATDSIYMTESGGLMIWDRPIHPGRYAVGINVWEGRRISGPDIPTDTIFLSTTLRAMTIWITEDLIVSNFGPKPFSGILRIYPNPTSNSSILYLDYALPNQEGKVTISNNLGQIVFTVDLESNRQVRQLKIPIRNWPAGFYTLTIKSGPEQITKKVLIQH